MLKLNMLLLGLLLLLFLHRSLRCTLFWLYIKLGTAANRALLLIMIQLIELYAGAGRLGRRVVYLP